MKAIFINVIVFVPLVAFFIWAAKKGRSRVRILLNHWIQDNGYTLVESKRVHFKTGFNTGPYRLVNKGQTVLRVTVLDENNINRTGWVRCAHSLKAHYPMPLRGCWMNYLKQEIRYLAQLPTTPQEVFLQ